MPSLIAAVHAENLIIHPTIAFCSVSLHTRFSRQDARSIIGLGSVDGDVSANTRANRFYELRPRE